MFSLDQIKFADKENALNKSLKDVFKINLFFFGGLNQYLLDHALEYLKIKVPDNIDSIKFFCDGYRGFFDELSKTTKSYFNSLESISGWFSFYYPKPKYIHEMREYCVSNDKILYKKLLTFFQKVINKDFDFIQNFGDFDISDFYGNTALLKLYLNESLNDQERQYFISAIYSDYFCDKYFVESIISIKTYPDFFKNIISENQIVISKFACELCSLNIDYVLYEKIFPLVANFDQDPLELYFREGISEKNSNNDLVCIYEAFFTGDFERCKKLLLNYKKNHKEELKQECNYPYVMMLEYCRMQTNSDVAILKRELNALIKKNLSMVNPMVICAAAILYLYALRNGQKESFEDFIPEFADKENSFELREYNSKMLFDKIYFLKRFSCHFIYHLIIMSALHNEDLATIYYSEEPPKNIIALNKVQSALASRLYKSYKSYAVIDFIEGYENLDYYDFSKVIDIDNIWRTQLDTVIDLLKINKLKVKEGPRKKEVKKASKHLAWIFDNYKNNFYATPYVIDCNDNGENAQIKDKYEVSNFFNSRGAKHTFLSDQDRAVASGYNRVRIYGRNSYSYIFTYDRSLVSLEGHPYLYILDEDQNCIHMQMESRKVNLYVKQEKNDIYLSVNAGIYEIDANTYISCGFDLEKQKIYLYRVEKIHRELANILGTNGTKFPLSALDEVLTLGKSSDVEVNFDIDSNKVESLSRPVVLLANLNKGYNIKLRIKVIDDDSCPYKMPAFGEESLIFTPKNQKLPIVAKRNFTKENLAIEKVINTLSKLNDLDEDGNYSYFTDSTQDILELIEQIHNFSEICDMHWSEGKGINVQGALSSTNFKLLGDLNASEYLTISGKVELSEGRFISLKTLLEAISDIVGNYIKVDEENYYVITKELKNKLQKLKALTTAGKKDEVLANPLAGQVIGDLLSDFDCQFSSKVKVLLKRRDEAFNMEFKVPKLLKADLRSYQLDGFNWLCRLAHWGVGGCLADDMGLGKTIQTIATMLMLAKKGPILVIAPTSVCPNWENEIYKFAPTLKVKRLKYVDDRELAIKEMQAGEVLIVSYGLFAIEAQALSEVMWQMTVYDEAQALKNSLTQRAKTALMIKAKMSLALTGTPIENNLDDLWSIFNIINPGLLGSKESFHKRFCNVLKDKATNRALKLLISPFILRRLKGDVLDDLPPRTEQLIVVENSVREQELYEALRLSTLEKLANNTNDLKKSGQRRLQILSALTKLRQFCCDPALVSDELNKSDSSKTQAFSDLLDEALSGGHRLLVFSQFVGYLTKIRALVEKKGIDYQYLDGQSSEKERALAVQEFQSGNGDVFLISLKAGGQGLNLTGADYVVHLDPWWNPAVEDQATDRAYRIGQTRPVNVIRLVIKDTLEEKILELHAKKREIAADFLDGNSIIANEALKLSEEELLDLIN